MNCCHSHSVNPVPVYKVGDWVYISKGIKAEVEGVTGEYDMATHYIIGGQWHDISKIHQLNNTGTN